VNRAGIFVLAAALAAGPRIALAQPGVVIRSTTRLVEVHVVAEDDRGNPVADLRKEDFQIFDERKERPLALFTVEGTSPAAVSGAHAGGVEVTETATAPGYSAILLDWLNGSFSDRLRAVDAVRKVLRTFQPGQQVALYMLGMEPPNTPHPLRMIQDFKEATVEIADAIEDPLVLPSPEIAEAVGKFDARFGSGRRAMNVEEQLFDWNNRILDTVRALTELARQMGRLPGRKSLIWLSTGFPIVINGSVVPGAQAAEAVYLDEVDRVLAQLNREDVTVHTVNTVGLSLTERSYGDTLTQFAERTGGTVFSNRNDLDVGVRIALDDMHAGYTLGFLVPEGAAPGMHKIQVRTRRPRVRLRFRESYQLEH
jgi:VWFA-related protein